MSPARAHRERHAARPAAAHSATPIATVDAGGATPARPPELTPALQHRLAHAAAANTGDDAPTVAGIDPATAQMMLCLQHDLRRLKAIQSVAKKIEAKREMLPQYRDWVSARIRAAQETGRADPDEILPTMMVWLIDTGDYENALTLAEHVLRFGLPLPARYERSAPALIVEEIANAALKAQGAGESFDLDVLEQVDLLTEHADMHDQIRAKLMKALGTERMRAAEAEGAAPDTIEAALAPLRRAHALHDRVGVKDKIKRLEKLAEAAPAKTTGESA